jgi:two-component system, NtrC family, sensor kinase
MRTKFIILLICLAANRSFSQSMDLEGMKYRLPRTTNDTVKLLILDSLSVGYSESVPDSSLYYADMGIDLAQTMGVKILEASAMNMKAYALLNLGNYPASLRLFLDAIDIAQDPASEESMLPKSYRRTMGIGKTEPSTTSYRLQILSFLYLKLVILYENANNPDKALDYYRMCLKLGEETGNDQVVAGTSMNIGRIYISRNKNDSAILLQRHAYDLYNKLNLHQYQASNLLNLGRGYLADGQNNKAIEYFREAIRVGNMYNYLRGVIAANLILSNINLKAGRFDSALYYIEDSRRISSVMRVPDLTLRLYNALATYYQALPDKDSSVKYLNLVILMKDSLSNAKRAREFQNIDYDAQQRKKEIELARKNYRDQLQKYLLLSGLAIFLVIALILWKNNRNKLKAYRLLAQQKEETELQKTQLQTALNNLKQTQNLLIQKEKMASLGELTAGIAHEIENPLNFVNNFSEVNSELNTELRDAINDGNLGEAGEILSILEENQQRILQHGKRADAIVKAMLQHSRIGSNAKELSDINVLCDEYSRLALRGMQAKDKFFNAEIKTDFDTSVGIIPAAPQDMGRVILNLLNNAFYAVDEKAKQNIPGYEPLVTISTKRLNHEIEIAVKDNGIGIPDAIKEKIFQPFFTTKPAGQGTGLGLSLSYDIIKAHNGEMLVSSKEGEGTEFIVQIPA